MTERAFCKCGEELYTADELELNACQECLDEAYRRRKEREEWKCFHPVESGEDQK